MKSGENSAPVMSGGDLLGGEREHEMISPRSVDMDRRTSQPLGTQMQLLDHPQARGILRAHRHLDAVDAELGEEMIDHQGHRPRDEARSRLIPVDPVAQHRAAQRSVLDGSCRDLADDPAPHGDHQRKVEPEARLLLVPTSQRGEGYLPGWAIRVCGIPWAQPVTVSLTQPLEVCAVTASQGPQSELPVAQCQRPHVNHRVIVDGSGPLPVHGPGDRSGAGGAGGSTPRRNRRAPRAPWPRPELRSCWNQLAEGHIKPFTDAGTAFRRNETGVCKNSVRE